jgi:hypothetical protein
MYQLLVVFVLSFLTVFSARGSELSGETAVRLEKAFIPIGFDDNDHTQVVVSGILPDTCYKLGSYNVKIDENKQVVYVKQMANVRLGPCLDVIIPFSEVINVGPLKEGSYIVVDSASGGTLGQLPVNKATKPTIDDYLYLPLTDANVRTDSAKHSFLQLDGKFSDRCTRYKKSLIHYYKDVIVVQPIVDHIESQRCGHEPTRFQITEPLADGLKGTYLLHVRSMEGQAVNKLVEFD